MYWAELAVAGLYVAAVLVPLVGPAVWRWLVALVGRVNERREWLAEWRRIWATEG